MTDNAFRFSEKLSARIMDMHQRGLSAENIAGVLGPGKTKESIAAHIRWKNISPEKRAKRRDQINTARQQRVLGIPKVRASNREWPAPKPPAGAVVERDRRLARPFNIGIDLLGDPEPGRSALDRKLAGATS